MREERSSEPLIQVRELKKSFRVGSSQLKAVDGVSFEIHKGETLGLVGESGCGKSTVGRMLTRMVEPTEGRMIFDGQNVLDLTPQQMMNVRKDIQFIFQDPYASLNPRMTVREIVAEPLDIHGVVKKKKQREHVKDMLHRVGLQSEHMSRYPHEFSGGQRQRIGIARALALMPRFLVCDEPLSALDVSVQAQIVNLMKDLQQELALTYLFIAHDLSIVKTLSHRVLVMYLGHMMETADSERLYENPLHPYTQALLSAIPEPDPERERERIVLQGDVPSPMHPPQGCVFATRCAHATNHCHRVRPEWREIEPGHYCACHLYNEAL